MEYNASVEDLQATEYAMLKNSTYLDHGGTTLYAKSLIDAFALDLASNLYGNPHSASTPARLSGQIVDDVRERALNFFGADPKHFDLVFVANATAAIKLVMESFRDVGFAYKSINGDERGFWYGYHIDSHNSVIGVRESCEGGQRCFRTDLEVEQWLSGSSNENKSGRLGLFAYPGQSNMTGRRLPLNWPGNLRKSTHTSHRDTYSLLDAAALATTFPLNSAFYDPDLAPDFTALSFYKIFGFPDLGALIVRKASGKILQWRKYFGGGTVSMVTVLGNNPWFASREMLHGSLEDGTLPFHSIIALGAAIDTHKRLYGPDPMITISRHTNFLGKHLYDAMSSLRHSTGVPICQIYKGANSVYGNSTTQGATISFNVTYADGTYIPYTSVVEKLANERHIYVRAGQLCNPGGIATNLGYDTWHMKRLYAYGHRCGGAAETGTEVVNGKPTGVVRASLGAMTTIANIDTLVKFLREEFMDRNTNIARLSTESQIGNLAGSDKNDTLYSSRTGAHSNGAGYSQDSLVGLPHFAPSQSGDSVNDAYTDASLSTRVNRSSPSVFDRENQNYQIATTSLQTWPRYSASDEQKDFDTASAKKHLGFLSLQNTHTAPRGAKEVDNKVERRGLKKIWQHRRKKSGLPNAPI